LLWAAVALAVHDPAVVIGIANAAPLPLSFAGDIFVQPGSKPGRLRAFVDVNPPSQLAGAARDLMNNTGGAVAWSLTETAVITLVRAPITPRLYGGGVEGAIRQESDGVVRAAKWRGTLLQAGACKS
jgi:hypothetical protein